MEARILEWLAHYGTPVVFFAQVFGIFGLPIPDEFMLTIAGGLIRAGRLHGWVTVGAAVGGCMSGITLSYVIGRTVGLAVLRRVLHIPEHHLARAHRWFDRVGHWLLTFGYFIPGVRHVTAIAAGSTPIGFGTFAAWAYPGAVLWSCTFLAIGYYAGSGVSTVMTRIHHHVRPAAFAVAVAIAVVVVVRARRPDPPEPQAGPEADG